MNKYLLIYHFHSGPSEPPTEDEVAHIMQSWQDWFAQLGDALVERGSSVGKSVTVLENDEIRDGGPNPAGGYSVLQADSQETVVALVKYCPLLRYGGSVEVAPFFEEG